MKFLSPGEKIYLSFKTSRKYPKIFKYYFFGALLLFLTIAVLFNLIDFSQYIIGIRLSDPVLMIFSTTGVIFLIIGEMRRRRFGTYHITNYRIVFTRGFLGTSMDSVSYTMIVNIKVTQNALEQLLGVGNLDISTAKGSREIDMIGVANPSKIENMIYNFMGGRAGPVQTVPKKQKYPQRYPQTYPRRYPQRYRR